MSLTLNEISARLGGEVVGDGNKIVTGFGTLLRATPSELAFLANPIYRSQLNSCQAGAVILAPVDRDATSLDRIVTKNPYAYFARAAALFLAPRVDTPGIHRTAVIGEGCQIADSATIGPMVSVGAGARIGERTIVHSNAHIAANVRIGSNCVIYPNVVVYCDCELGDRVIAHAGVVIGADGFGFAFDSGEWIKVPQVGRVVIENDVEIGANTTIDRGAIDDTLIETGVKLDNQIQIGHNVRIGAHTVIAGCTGIAGSTSIGRHCRIGGGVGIVGHLNLCDGVTITARTLVTKSITKAGIYSGVPHTENREWLKTTVQLRRMDTLLQRVTQLEQEIKAIKGRSA